MTTYIASAEKYKGLIKEDISIRDYLVSKEIHSEILTLNEIVGVARQGDTVILKSIWGYHLSYEHFLKQIVRLKDNSIILVNDYKYIYWNIDKFAYISEIQNFKGINIIPTNNLNLKECESTEEVKYNIELAGVNYEENILIIKPTISASGYLTLKYFKNKDNMECLSKLLEHKDLEYIIQPFRELVSEGEISVIITNGNIRYAIHRYPGVLSEKSDPEFISLDDIHPTILNQVHYLMNFFNEKFDSPPKICRIDFVKNKSNFELMEIELIDPDLFFKYLPEHILNDCLKDICGA